jgi:hypothetical protein
MRMKDTEQMSIEGYVGNEKREEEKEGLNRQVLTKVYEEPKVLRLQQGELSRFGITRIEIVVRMI